MTQDSTSPVSFGFPKHYKLATSADFKRVMQGGARRYSSSTFLLLAKRNTHAHARLGVIVSKKACRRANQRNRVKRLMRESFRLNTHSLMAVDVVILIKKGREVPDNSHIFKELGYLWQQLSKQFGKS